MISNNIKYLLIDLDGTLLDFNKGEKMAFIKTIEEFGKFTPNEDQIKLFSDLNEKLFNMFARGEIPARIIFQERRFKEIFEMLNINASDELANKYFLNELKKSGYLFDDIGNSLDYLKSKYKLYIASNGMSEVQYKRLENAGILNIFDDIFVSSDAGANKPDKIFFDYCINKINDNDMSKYVMIGDRLDTDILGAKNLGMSTIFINRNNLVIDEIVPDVQLESFSDILNIL